MSRPRRRRPRLRAVTVAGLALPLLAGAGCTSDSTHATSLDPRASLDALSRLPSFTVSGAVARGDQRGPLSARYARRPDRALVRAPVDVGSRLARVEVRRVGGHVWVRRAVVTTGGTTPAVGLLAVRAPGAAPFVAVERPHAEPATRIVDAYDPRVLLERVVDAHVRRMSAAADIPAPEGTTAYQLRPTAAQSRRLGLRLLTVTATPNGLPVRVSYMTTAQVRVTYRVRPGTPAPRVAPPAPALVAPTPTDAPLPDATGPYTAVGTVTADTTPVTIGSAPAAGGGTCWKVLAPAGYTDLAEVRPSGGVCVPPLDGDAADRFAIPLDGVSPTPFDLVAFLVPQGSSGTARYADGTDRPLQPAGDLLVAAGAATPPAVLVTLSVPGARLVCGPGPVSAASDLDGLGGRQVSALRDAPWNCTEDPTG